jgi:uncharacterized protein
MKELIEFIIRSLVDHPEGVQVTEVQSPGSTLVEISVDEADMGRVIGKGGRVINSVRTLAQVLAARQGTRVTIELLEADERI